MFWIREICIEDDDHDPNAKLGTNRRAFDAWSNEDSWVEMI